MRWIGAAGLAAAAAAGCDAPTASPLPAEIRQHSPATLSHRPGEIVGPVVVRVLSEPIQGVPGRNGFRDPVPDVPVSFEVKGWSPRVRSVPADGGAPLERAGAWPPLPPRLLEVEGAQDAARATIANEGLSAVVRTDANGLAAVRVRLGMAVGDFRVRAEIRNVYQQRRDVEFLLVSGVEILDRGREGPPGSRLPVTVQVWRVEAGGAAAPADDGDGGREPAPAEGDGAAASRSLWKAVPEGNRTVYFTLVGGAGSPSAALDKDRDDTNSQGIAKVDLQLGRGSGGRQVLVELKPATEPDDRTAPALSDGVGITRGLVVEHYVLDHWQLGLAVLGGLAFFAVGLRLFGDGLVIQLSPYLHLLTGAFARRRMLGFTGGLGVGAAFLSSSAVLSHLVSFANGGLLSAAAASAILLGANIGKTIVFHLAAFPPVVWAAIPLAALGTVFLVLPGRSGSRSWGQLLLGLGLLFLGWQFLDQAASIMSASPGVKAALASWDPGAGARTTFARLFVLASDCAVAAAVAFVLRNSNLAVAGFFVLAVRGAVSFEMALPAIAGAGIGSAAGALLASLKRNREARRLAASQLVYQSLGALWLLFLTALPAGSSSLVLRLVDWATPGRLLGIEPENPLQHLAVLYTLYHLANGVLFVALDPWIQNLIGAFLPRDPVHEDVKPFRLDSNLVTVPSLALAQATREVGYLGELVRKEIAESFDAFRYLDLNLTDQIARREETIAHLHASVSQYLLRVSENSLSVRDATRLESLQAAAGNFGKIGELGDQLCHSTARLLEEKLSIPEDLARELTEIYELVIAQFENVLHLLENQDPRIEENAIKVGERIAKGASRSENLWVQRLRQLESGAPAAVAVFITRQAYDTLANVAMLLTHVAQRIRILAAR
jgi:phosphate:Na+ symporter